MATNCNNYISDILENRFTASSVLTNSLKTKGNQLTSCVFISLLKSPLVFLFKNYCNN